MGSPTASTICRKLKINIGDNYSVSFVSFFVNQKYALPMHDNVYNSYNIIIIIQYRGQSRHGINYILIV